MSKFKGKLLPHQEEAKKKYEQSGAILLYHGLGSGKTITSIGSAGDKEEGMNKIALGWDSTYKKNGKIYSTRYETSPFKGAIKEEKMSPDYRGRYTYSKTVEVKKSDPFYQKAVELVKKSSLSNYEKIAGKLKEYVQRRREERKQYSGGRAPRPITARTAVGTLFQLSSRR